MLFPESIPGKNQQDGRRTCESLFTLGNGRRRGELTYFFSLFPWPHQEAFGILSP